MHFPRFEVQFAPDPANKDRVIISGESGTKIIQDVRQREIPYRDKRITRRRRRCAGPGMEQNPRSCDPAFERLGITAQTSKRKKANGTHYIAARMGAYKVFEKTRSMPMASGNQRDGRCASGLRNFYKVIAST